MPADAKSPFHGANGIWMMMTEYLKQLEEKIIVILITLFEHKFIEY
jgi:succinate dehydrogenase hydrophobic anchor subunit